MSTRQSSFGSRRVWGSWLKRGSVVVGAAVGIGFLGMSLRPRPIPVDVAEVIEGPLTVTVTEDGRARVQDRYVVGAPIGGRLARITLESGQDVTAGETVARIIPNVAPLLDERSRSVAQARVSAAKAAKKGAKAQIDRADAALEFARAEAKRLRRLAANEFASRRQLDEARMDERTAAADLASAQLAFRVADYELQQARAALVSMTNGASRSESFAVTAPVAGRVLEVHQESEGVVQPGMPLLTIGDPSALEVVVDVLTRDAVQIHPGSEVSVIRWGGPPLAAVVRRVEPSAFTRLSALGVEEQRVNVIIDLLAPPSEWTSLNDGYRIEARVTLWHSDRTVTVPASAVFRHRGRWAVYRVVAGLADRTEVTLGRRTGRRVEITKGLTPGGWVILHPSDRVQTGVAVEPKHQDHK